MSDRDLLQQFSRDNSQAAFTALVQSHLNLVYSAARRQVRSSHLAEEVSQLVFLDLARHAGRLRPDQPLAAWLYVVTRRTAVDVLRRESRRRIREESAAELAAMKTPSENWPKVEALVDEAMASLNDSERDAIVLRYFENLSLREVGEALGISEDTAQKRVSRALDRLRRAFGRRGLALGATALTSELSAHAVLSAPAGLAATISSSAASLSTVAALAARQLAMTTSQKFLAATALTVSLGLVVFEGGAAFNAKRQADAGRRQVDRLAETARQLSVDQAAIRRELSRLSPGASETASVEPGSDAALGLTAAKWLARIDQLKDAFKRHPELSIPEIQLLNERDWLLAAINDTFSNEEAIRDALRFLRTRAKQNFINNVASAARKFVGTNNGVLPSHFQQLSPFLQGAIDPAIVARYEFQSENGRVSIAEKRAGAADLDRLALCALELSKRGLDAYAGSETETARSVRLADQAFAATHAGARATDPEQLRPYLSQPLDAPELAGLFRKLPFTRTSPTP